MLVAKDGTGDLAFLSLTDPEFDLSDRGVEGREPAPPVDLWLTTDRGAYRAGEQVNVTALSRDSGAAAVEGLPMTWVLFRPDGVESARGVVADTAGKWPYVEDLTSDFVYMRLHGDVELYSSGYTAHALRRWKQRIVRWSQGGQVEDAQLIVPGAPPQRASRDIYCYFDNDQKVHAPYDARRLLSKLKLDGELVTEPGVEPQVDL